MHWVSFLKPISCENESLMEIAKKRKMQEVLRNLINSGFKGTQEDLCEVLQKRGFDVTQSTVSRALKKMGVVKSQGIEGNKYLLQPATPFTARFDGSLAGLVTSFRHNGSIIVLKTRPGSAMFIAGYIDHHFAADILGSIAGDDTLFVAPVNCRQIEETIKKMRSFLFEEPVG